MKSARHMSNLLKNNLVLFLQGVEIRHVLNRARLAFWIACLDIIVRRLLVHSCLFNEIKINFVVVVRCCDLTSTCYFDFFVSVLVVPIYYQRITGRIKNSHRFFSLAGSHQQLITHFHHLSPRTYRNLTFSTLSWL